MKANKTFQWVKGDILAISDVPVELSHFFDNPLHYHWNYPNNTNEPLLLTTKYEIVKSVFVELFGATVVISFL